MPMVWEVRGDVLVTLVAGSSSGSSPGQRFCMSEGETIDSGHRNSLWSRALLLVLAISIQACGAESSATWTTSSPVRPSLFEPGVISTEMREYGITFSPDAREAYFTRRARGGQAQIFVSYFRGGLWSEPVRWLFSGVHDEAPHVSSDGASMVFVSRRPMPESGDRSDNIWISERTEAGWGIPTPLSGAVNRPRLDQEDFGSGMEMGPSMLPDGSILFWSRADPDWGADIYRSQVGPDGTYGHPTALTLNSPGDESNAVLVPGGNFLIFQAYRDATAPGNQDLYVSRRNSFGWDAAVHLPAPINSAFNDGYPSVSPDGSIFFFASDRRGASGYYDIWYVDASSLNLDALTR